MLRTMVVVAVMALVACGPGEMGPPGPAGAVGPAGPKGDQGTPGVGLTGGRVCFGTQLFGSVAVTAIYLRYDFSDGSAFITCEVQPTNGTEERKVSLPTMYRPTDTDIATGRCSVNHDVNTANGRGSGSFDFSVTAGAAIGRATYRDPSGAYEGTVISLDCEGTQ